MPTMRFSGRGLLGAVLVCLAATMTNAAAADDSIEPKYLSNVRQVTDGFIKAGEGYFSPDGDEIVFQAVPPDYPFYQIFYQTLPGNPRRISTGEGRTTCAAFNPDGKHLIFASSHLDPNLQATEQAERDRQAEDARTGTRRRYQWDFDPYMDIFASDLQGHELKQLTHEKGYDAEGSFSPDGRTIVFCSDRDGDPDLYLMNADGSNVRRLTNEPGYDGGPFFSPDGKWIIYRSDRRQKEHLQIHVIGVDGQHDTAWTDNLDWVYWAPYWHPTQPFVIWTAADHSHEGVRPNYDLYLQRYETVDGQPHPVGEPIRVTDNPAADVLPVFSPNGKQLMWTSGRTDNHSSQLFLGDFKLPK